MAPLDPSSELPFPVELLREIIKLLSTEDQQTLSLVSQLTRSETIPFIFGHLSYSGSKVLSKVRNMNQARKEVKEVVKKLELRTCSLTVKDENDKNVIYEFLETLPNLHAFEYCQSGRLLRPTDFSWLIYPILHAPLLELSIDTGIYTYVKGLPTEGPRGLEKLSITWRIDDDPNKPGSAKAHLYELIRPSLPTLVELKLDNEPGPDLDLSLLRAAGDTLHTFECRLRSSDESILETIAEIFPRLTKLSVTWDTDVSVLWKDAHIDSLAKNQNLVDLTLSCDFEESVDDTLAGGGGFSWYVRCYTRRLLATQDVAFACVRLQRCSWVQRDVDNIVEDASMIHPFIVEEQVAEGNTTRVVRGVQQKWMGRDNIDWHTGGVVKCKLEDLPGNIVGQNEDEE